MNLLAHALLSPPNPAVLTGNLTADWIKGRIRRTLPADIQRGMALHQQIDNFTDAHPLVERCSNLLAPKWGRYAPVLVDILFDHVLSVDWPAWCALPRTALITVSYSALRQNLSHLPERAQYAASALLADDWLSTYSTLEGIALSLTRLSARLNARGHEIELAPATADFQRHETEFHHAFQQFLPALRHHVESHLADAVN
jgi:acyl carrier protein phosphodiesterase